MQTFALNNLTLCRKKNSVPSFTANVIATYPFSKKVFVNLNARYVSSQFSPITALGSATSVSDNYVDAALILNVGINVKLKNLVMDFRVKNLADTEYYSKKPA